jgi:hypothetical protein
LISLSQYGKEPKKQQVQFGTNVFLRLVYPEPATSINLRNLQTPPGFGRPFNFASVAPQLGGIAISQECPRCDELSTLLASLSEAEKLTVGFEAGLFEELSPGRCERLFIVITVFTLWNGPSSLVLPGPVGTAWVD